MYTCGLTVVIKRVCYVMLYVSLPAFDGISGHRLIGCRRKRASVIGGDVTVRTLVGVHRRRYVTQDGRFVDLGANTDPQRHYQTRRYADVRALYIRNKTPL